MLPDAVGQISGNSDIQNSGEWVVGHDVDEKLFRRAALVFLTAIWLRVSVTTEHRADAREIPLSS